MSDLDHTCGICGKQETGNYFPDVADRLSESRLCHTCDFWQPKISAAANNDPRSVRIDGSHFWIGDERAKGMRGYGGSKFRIRFTDGREVETTNLWCQGGIPERFRDSLPDNAAFVTEREEIEQ